jgi:hypothetical protein
VKTESVISKLRSSSGKRSPDIAKQNPDIKIKKNIFDNFITSISVVSLSPARHCHVEETLHRSPAADGHNRNGIAWLME